ncbi:hypothetical protein A3D72_02065 [Candidatus Uhrbacteria bacterium RIFCSPHIGHO2_02_FULL_57_19]|uniref:50S ribosomal protein L7/L12 n=1 Tax=Candidatus Uhrbacteria bacterium RIFCSPHIGHO2_02_FULL_57_19 TaxID=1802391 RepID=A0A1F7U4H0_9BACT|nr:MAG: hypothetical protein A3D72_02065 [Candidatus Uhrbacteria bacterium RIFCSPHIGHO2_02_FULL_57_19]
METQTPTQNTQPPESKIAVLRSILRSIQSQTASALTLLEEGGPVGDEARRLIGAAHAAPTDVGGRVIEGVFDGQHMTGSDGKQYHVPPNYASKSKLVEGDMLKLTITPQGSFIFKQIGPIERTRIVGELAQDSETKQHSVIAGEKSWNILTASVTFFHGEPGDEAVILVPQTGPSRWAAVENIIKKTPII